MMMYKDYPEYSLIKSAFGDYYVYLYHYYVTNIIGPSTKVCSGGEYHLKQRWNAPVSETTVVDNSDQKGVYEALQSDIRERSRRLMDRVYETQV